MRKCPSCGNPTVRKNICMRCQRKNIALAHEQALQDEARRRAERAANPTPHHPHNSFLLMATLVAMCNR